VVDSLTPITASADRGLSPVVSAVLLVALTVALAGTVAYTAGTVSLQSPPDRATIDLEAHADTHELTFEHTGGDPLDVEGLTLEVTVDDDGLAEPPPVPFVGAPGYYESPTGPFNAAGDTTWQQGETASFRLASTNEPLLEDGAVVRVHVSQNGQTVTEVTTVAC